MGCRKMSLCEINDIINRSDRALCVACGCGGKVSGFMDCAAVKINGEYRLTLSGRAGRAMLNAIADGQTVTCKFSGTDCCGKYCVTASGEPYNVRMRDNCTVCFNMTDLVTDGVLNY